jgi:hypothetical protein
VADPTKKLRRQLRHLSWREVPLQHRTREQSYGRCEIRRLKVCTVQPGLLFPYAVQAIEVKRRTSRTTNKTTSKTIYAVTSLAPEQATPLRIAELIRGHWQVEALHHVRDRERLRRRAEHGTPLQDLLRLPHRPARRTALRRAA